MYIDEIRETEKGYIFIEEESGTTHELEGLKKYINYDDVVELLQYETVEFLIDPDDDGCFGFRILGDEERIYNFINGELKLV